MKWMASSKSPRSPGERGILGAGRRPLQLGLAEAPEEVVAQRLKLAGEAHDVDQWRAQVVRDDIGIALDLGIRLFEIGGAFRHPALELGVSACTAAWVAMIWRALRRNIR